jgi:hypothetical protein
MLEPRTDPDQRADAFAALLEIAPDTDAALARVQSALDDERQLVGPLRSGFHPTQHAGLNGTSRFAYTVREWGQALETHPSVRRISSERQEAQNIFMWLLDDRYVLRVKHDLEEIIDPGATTLFSLEPQASPTVVFLTWDTIENAKIRGVAFATVDEPRWTIPLAELLASGAGRPEPVTPPRPQVKVRSKHARPGERDQSGRG